MRALYKKELDYYLNNPVGYIILILFSVFVNFFYIKDIFVVGSGSMRPFFSIMPWFLVIFVPALSMRIFSEEKRLNTLETLLTLPLREVTIIIAKYLALLTLLFIGLILTAALPVTLSVISRLYIPEIVVGYMGMFLVGAAFTAIAMFFSSLTKNQVVAFLTSTVVLFFLTVVSSEFLASVLPKSIQDVITLFGPLNQVDSFVKGIVDVRSLTYFVSVSLIFLFFTKILLEKRD